MNIIKEQCEKTLHLPNKKSRGLLFDTATVQSVVALVEDGIIIKKKNLPKGLSSAQALLPSIDTLCQDGIQIDYVAVGKGPGSYSGLRVGAAFAKALSFAWNIPLIPFRTLLSFIPENYANGIFLSVIDARVGGVYSTQMTVQENDIQFEEKDHLVPFDRFLECVKTINGIITPEAAPLIRRFEEANIAMPFIQERAPCLDFLAHSTFIAYIEKSYTGSDYEIAYMLKTQAEREREAKL